MADYKLGIHLGRDLCFAGVLDTILRGSYGSNCTLLQPDNEKEGIPTVFWSDGRQLRVGLEAQQKETNRVDDIMAKLASEQALLTVGGVTFTVERVLEELIGYVARSAERKLQEYYLLNIYPHDRFCVVLAVPQRYPDSIRQMIYRVASRVTMGNGSRLCVINILPEVIVAPIGYLKNNANEENDESTWIGACNVIGSSLELAYVYMRFPSSWNKGFSFNIQRMQSYEGRQNTGGKSQKIIRDFFGSKKVLYNDDYEYQRNVVKGAALCAMMESNPEHGWVLLEK